MSFFQSTLIKRVLSGNNVTLTRSVTPASEAYFNPASYANYDWNFFLELPLTESITVNYKLVYTYPGSAVTEEPSSFTISAGSTSYTVGKGHLRHPDTDYSVAFEVTGIVATAYTVVADPVSLSQVIPNRTAVTAKAIPDPNTLTWEAQPLTLTDAMAVNGTITVQNRNIQSLDSQVPAINCDSLSNGIHVEVLACNLRFAGYGVKCWYKNNNLTVKNCFGWGATPTAWVDYKKPRVMVFGNHCLKVIAEHNYMENTAGIVVEHPAKYVGTGRQNPTIRFNKVKNIDGRIFNNDSDFAQFVQIRGNAVELGGGEIAWNQIINEPNNSKVEDNINVYQGRGIAGSPIRIHNNLIHGAYPLPANATSQYSGGGIIMDSKWGCYEKGDPANGGGPLHPAGYPIAEGADGSERIATAYVEVYDNHVINCVNYHLGIAGGNNIKYYNNRVRCSGKFDAAYYSGADFGYSTSGLWGNDFYGVGRMYEFVTCHATNATFAAETYNNDIKLTRKEGGGHLGMLDGVTDVNNATGACTKQEELDELNVVWPAKLNANNILVGPIA